MINPFSVLIEELKAEVAFLRDRRERLIENRQRMPDQFSSNEHVAAARQLQAALRETAAEIEAHVRRYREMAVGSVSLFDRTNQAWTEPMVEFDREIETKIRMYEEMMAGSR